MNTIAFARAQVPIIARGRFRAADLGRTSRPRLLRQILELNTPIGGIVWYATALAASGWLLAKAPFAEPRAIVLSVRD